MENEAPYQNMIQLVSTILRVVFVCVSMIWVALWVYESVSAIKKTKEARVNFHASCATFATGGSCNQLWVALQQMIMRDMDKPQDWVAFACWLSAIVVSIVLITLTNVWRGIARLVLIACIGDHVLSKLETGQDPFAPSESASSNLSD
ncbi:MAG: hypothetical protein CMP20_09310 [Rickettsiales bacterium]|nr:hypothetical protein [Rickettsiales bacterium]